MIILTKCLGVISMIQMTYIDGIVTAYFRTGTPMACKAEVSLSYKRKIVQSYKSNKIANEEYSVNQLLVMSFKHEK